MSVRTPGWKTCAVVVAVQAAVYFTHLGLLSPWMDEVTTLTAVRQSFADVIRTAAGDIHPPLYYMLVWCFERIPLHLDWAVQARALSVLFALAATVVLDRLWANRLPQRGRICVLALWAASPCLLLYARMCRSYSLQVLVGILAVAAIARASEKATQRADALLAGALALALYTHYALGLALAAAANLVLLRRRRLRAALFIDAAVAVLYLPWIYFLFSSMLMWGHSPQPAQLALKLAYWGISFTMGEAVPDAVLIAGLAVLPLVAAMALAGAARDRELLWILAPLAAVGFLGVARWVSYPFVPARMLFVLPFFLLLVVEGALRYRRVGAMAVAALLALSGSGIWCYFQETGFRNKQYPMPMTQIAGQIRASSQAGEAGILVDGSNSDPPALAYALGGWPAVLSTTDPAAEKTVARMLADPRVRTFWFLRNTHDVSASGLDARFEQQLGAGLAAKRFEYEPFSPLETRLMRAMGMREPPRYFHELVEYRR